MFCQGANNRLQLWCLLFVAFFAMAYLFHGGQITPDPVSPDRFYLLTGDEPHYLLVAASIAMDGDIDLFNNRSDGEYKYFYDRPVSGYVKNREYWSKFVRGSLRDAPDSYWERRAYSICPIGMPLLIAPAYRLARAWDGQVRYCVAIFFHLMFAATAVLMIYLSWRLTQRLAASIACGAALALSAPLFFFTYSVYSDLPAALFLIAALALFSFMESSGLNKCRVGLASGVISFLPWLHMKFWLHLVVLMAFLVLLIVRRDARNPAVWVALLLPFAISLAGLGYYYWLLYGVPFPISTHPGASLKIGMTSGWPGLWLDRDLGLLWYMPLALLVFPGAILLWRRGGATGRLVILLLVLHWLATGTFSEWNGGKCPPMRYWVAAMPLFAPMLAIVFDSEKNRLLVIASCLAGALGLMVSYVGIMHPGRLYNYTHPLWPYLFPTAYERWAPAYFPTGNMKAYLAGLIILVLIVAATRWVLGRGTITHETRQSSLITHNK